MTSIPLFPLNTVLYPDGYLPLQIFEVRYLDMIRKCIMGEQPVGVVQLLDGAEVRKPGQQEALAPVGTLARVIDWAAPLSGLLQIKCMGMQRFHIQNSWQLPHGLWVADVSMQNADTAMPIPPHLLNMAHALFQVLMNMHGQDIDHRYLPTPSQLNDCGWVANRWAEMLPLPVSVKQQLMTLDSPLLRLELVADVLEQNGIGSAQPPTQPE